MAYPEKLISLVRAIVLQDDTFVLSRRSIHSKNYDPGRISLIGGKGLPGELARDTILRELQEELELGIAEFVVSDDPIGTYPQNGYSNDIFLARIDSSHDLTAYDETELASVASYYEWQVRAMILLTKLSRAPVAVGLFKALDLFFASHKNMLTSLEYRFAFNHGDIMEEYLDGRQEKRQERNKRRRERRRQKI